MLGTAAYVDAPPLTILEVLPDRPRDLAPLARALGGCGAPVGIRRSSVHARGILVELDTTVTSLAFLAVGITADVGRAREIRSIFPLDDENIAGLAALGLQAPDLDAGRMLEPYVEQWIAEHPR